jgi:hypothetical protein
MLSLNILLLAAYFLNLIYLSDNNQLFYLVLSIIIFLFILQDTFERKKYSDNAKQNLLEKAIKCFHVVSGLILVFCVISVVGELKQLTTIYTITHSINIILLLSTGFLSSRKLL